MKEQFGYMFARAFAIALVTLILLTFIVILILGAGNEPTVLNGLA